MRRGQRVPQRRPVQAAQLDGLDAGERGSVLQMAQAVRKQQRRIQAARTQVLAVATIKTGELGGLGGPFFVPLAAAPKARGQRLESGGAKVCACRALKHPPQRPAGRRWRRVRAALPRPTLPGHRVAALRRVVRRTRRRPPPAAAPRRGPAPAGWQRRRRRSSRRYAPGGMARSCTLLSAAAGFHRARPA